MHFMRQLGRGRFGTVVEGRTPTGEVVAAKVLVGAAAVPAAAAELSAIALAAGSPFIVSLSDAWRRGAVLVLCLEPALGGDLMTQLQRSRGPLRQEAACFYVAEVAQGLAFLTARRIAYRDLSLVCTPRARPGHTCLC